MPLGRWLVGRSRSAASVSSSSLMSLLILSSLVIWPSIGSTSGAALTVGSQMWLFACLFRRRLCDPLVRPGSEPSVTKSRPPAGVKRRPQLQQHQDPDPVRWSLSDLQPGHRGHVQAEGETSSIALTSCFIITTTNAHCTPKVIFISTRFRPVKSHF